MSRQWEVGEVFVLRHAGLPFDWLESLGFSEAVDERADAVLRAEQAIRDWASQEKGATRAARVGAELRRGKLGAAGLPAALFEAWTQARTELGRVMEDERAALRQALRQRASDLRVQEAVFLSSPAMYENIWRRYVDAEAWPDNSQGRRVERQAWTYLQRLCGKNETTSFFGPIAYGHVVDDDTFSVRVKPSGKSGRRTFFSYWAVAEMARAVARDPTLRAWLPIRRNPVFRFAEERAECESLGSTVALETQAVALLRMLEDGDSLHALAHKAQRSLQETERILLPLFRAAALVRNAEFTANAFETFETLCATVEGLPTSTARDAWRDRLRSIDALRGEFQQAGLAQRVALLSRIEASFTELTGKPARRGEGQIYSDRLVIYEEAPSPFAVELGRSFARSLGENLSGALELSACFGEQVQRRFGQEVVARLEGQGERIDFLSYVTRLRPEQVAGSRFSPVPTLPLEAAGDEVRLEREWLGRGSDGPRYALPDVCLSGPRADGAAPAGAYRALISRVHHHLLVWSWLGAFYPDPERYQAVSRRWIEQDARAWRIVGLEVRRRNKGFYVFPGKRLVYGPTDGATGSETLGPYDVSVRITPEGPQLEDRNGQRLFLYLPLDDFSGYPPFASLAPPQVLHAPLRSSSGQLPRVEIEGAIYQRARWEVLPQEIADATGMDLLLEVRRLRKTHGWPRFVFVRTDRERKPYLVDLRSPFALELLRHVAGGAEVMTVVEMYPPPEGLWLQGEEGRFTCEMRMQASRGPEDDPTAGEDVFG